MGTTKSKSVEERGEPEAAGEETPVETADPTETAEAEAPEAAQDPLAQLEQERDRLKEENLRLIAEARNQVNRFRREKEDALKYADGEFARELLLILDDLERTLTAADQAAEAKPVADGVRIVYEHFLKVLKERSIEPIEAAGREFDPTYHEALMKQPSDEHPRGHVIQEVARGYKMHERVLRPARVIVSSGPAAEAESD